MGYLNRDRLIGLGVGILSSVAFISCVSARFPYKYYAYDIQAHKLVAVEPKYDLDDTVCKPTPTSIMPCIVVLTSEFYSLKTDFLKTKEALIRCEKDKP